MTFAEKLFSKIPKLFGNSHYCVGRAVSEDPRDREEVYNYFRENELFSGSLLSSYFYDLKTSSSRDLKSLYSIVSNNSVWLDTVDNAVYINVRMGDVLYGTDGCTVSPKSISTLKKTFLTRPERLSDFITKLLVEDPNIDTIVLVCALHFQGDNISNKFSFDPRVLEKNFYYFSQIIDVIQTFGLHIEVLNTPTVDFVSVIDFHLLTLCMNKHVVLDKSKFSDFIYQYRAFQKKVSFKNIYLLNATDMELPLNSKYLPVHYGLKRCGANYFIRRCFHLGYYYFFVRNLCFKKRGISMSDIKIVDVEVSGIPASVTLIMHFPKNNLPEVYTDHESDRQRISINETCLLDHIAHREHGLFSICINQLAHDSDVTVPEKFVSKLVAFYNKTPIYSCCMRDPFDFVESNFNNEETKSKSLEHYMYSDELKNSLVTRYLLNRHTEELGEEDIDRIRNKLDAFKISRLSNIDLLLDNVFHQCYGIELNMLSSDLSSMLVVTDDIVYNYKTNSKFVLSEDFLNSDVLVHKKPTQNAPKLNLSGLTEKAQNVFTEKYKYDAILYDTYKDVVK
tara:strand:- start:836 stop:2527 length:1692 start_codon:yes stop_codon:yes gene_type:complete